MAWVQLILDPCPPTTSLFTETILPPQHLRYPLLCCVVTTFFTPLHSMQ